MDKRLTQGLEILGLKNDQAIGKALDVYLEELRLFNPSLKLIGDPESAWPVRHILDSVAPFSILSDKPFSTVADLGSGAGLPGLLMALFFPDCRMTLIERMGRRCDFLRNACAMMKLSNAEILESDLSQVEKKFDLVVMRAFLPFPKIEEPLLRIAKNGRIAAWKGKKNVLDEEISNLKILPRPSRIVSYEVPFLEEERNLVLFDL
jgi:16S rRNA (guanine527-N7)-methyltransferase